MCQPRAPKVSPSRDATQGFRVWPCEPGCAVKSNVQAFWRQHFVLNEGMLEVECPSVTPEVVPGR
jgi:glycyl-tRNA synthetase (class II)